MNSIWAALGGIIGGVTLMWSVFTFILNKRDDASKDERQNFYKTQYAFEDRTEKSLSVISDDIKKQNYMVTQLKLEVELQKEKYSRMIMEFERYVIKVDRMMQGHQDKLEHFGKILKVGK